MCRIMEELIDEGRTEGRAEGRIENLLDNIRQVMKNGKLSLTQAMDLLGLDEKDRKLVTEHLDQYTKKASRKAAGRTAGLPAGFCLFRVYCLAAAGAPVCGAAASAVSEEAAGRRCQMSASYWAMVRSEEK